MSLNPSQKAHNNGLWQPKLSNTSQEALIATQSAEKLQTKSFLQEVSTAVKELNQEAQLQNVEVLRLGALAGEVESKQRAQQARLADLSKLLEKQIKPVAPMTNVDAIDKTVRDALEQRRVILPEIPVQATGSGGSTQGDRKIKQPPTSNSDIPNMVIPQKATSTAKATQRESANALGATTTVRATSGLVSSSRKANTDLSANGEETESQQLQRSSITQQGSLIQEESQLVNSGSSFKYSGIRSSVNAAPVVGTESAIASVPVTQGPKATFPLPSLNSNIEVGIGRQKEHLAPVNPVVNEPQIPAALQNVLSRLPRPPPMTIPEERVFFPPSFFQEDIGGIDTVFTRVSRNKQRDQVYPWPEMIKVDPAQHQYALLIGEHGALNFIEDEQFTSELGEQYPLFRRGMLSRSWEYIGEYRVVHHMTIQPEVWKTTWDESLLSVTGLVKMDKVQIELFSFENRQKPASTTIMDLFEKEKEPCLRMSWKIVQCVGYNNELRDSLEKAHQAYEDYHRTPSAELSDSTNSEILQDQVDETEDEETDRGKREEDHGESEGEESDDGANSKVHQPVKQSKRKLSRSCHKRRRREWNSDLSDMNSVSIDELEQDLIDNEQAEHLRYYSDDSGPYSYQASDSDQENAERPRKRPRRSQRLSENYRKGKAMRKRQVL